MASASGGAGGGAAGCVHHPRRFRRGSGRSAAAQPAAGPQPTAAKLMAAVQLTARRCGVDEPRATARRPERGIYTWWSCQPTWTWHRVDYLRGEEEVLLTIFNELSRQLAIQSKDRASLMLSLADNYSGLLSAAVELTTRESSLLEEQRHQLAEYAEQVAALRRDIAEKDGTIADKDDTIKAMAAIRLGER